MSAGRRALGISQPAPGYRGAMSIGPFSSPHGRSPRADALPQHWRALHEAARLLAAMAGNDQAGAAYIADECPDSLRRAEGWRLALIDQGMADTAAILEGGIRGLLSAKAAGVPTRAAAQALLDEFVMACDTMLELAPPV